MSKKLRVKAVIFDFDNTLVDTHSAIDNAYSLIINSLSNRFGIEKDSLKNKILNAQKQVIDDVPLEKRVYDRRNVIAQLNKNEEFGLSDEELDKLAETFYDFIMNQITYPEYTKNILEALKERGKKLGLLTDTDVRPGFKKLRLSKLGFINLFDVVLIAGETIPQRKNSPLPFLEISRLLGVNPEDAVVIGDRMDADIDNAKEAGMKAILIDKYLPPNKGNYEPDFQIHDIKEVLDIIE